MPMLIPGQFYKPWELTNANEDTINAQVKEAEEIIEAETTQEQTENHAMDAGNDKPAERIPDEIDRRMETVGDETNTGNTPAPENSETTNNGTTANDEHVKRGPPDQSGDGDELVEGEEDAVIY